MEKDEWEKWNVGFSRGSLALLYTFEKGKTKKPYKLYTKPYTDSAFCWYSVFYDVYSLCFKLYTNYTQTLHWGVQNPTLRRSRPYTASVRKTIHEAEHKPYILFLNTNLANGTNEREWIVRNECNVRDERNERCSLFGRLLIKWTFFIQLFPHPTPFFGFNTSCFWRWKVLYLYRDMGGASAPPFFRHFPFKIGDFRSASGKNLPSSNFSLPSSSLN